MKQKRLISVQPIHIFDIVFDVTTSAEDWEKRAKSFMDRAEYELAEQCFMKACLPWESKVAHSYSLREQADSLQDWLSAADAFEDCASTFESLSSIGVSTISHLAAECYSRGREFARSAEIYEREHSFKDAAEQYYNGGMVAHAHAVIKAHSTEIPQSTSIFRRVCMYYIRSKNIRCVRNTVPRQHTSRAENET